MDEILAEARLLFPYLPEALIQVYANAWAESGSTQIALATMRTSPQYEATFPGIKRDDGTLRMTELEYLSTVEGYRTVLEEAGINPDLFDNDIVSLIEGDVSPAEFKSRVDAVVEQIDFGLPEFSQFLSEQLGVEDTRNALIVAALKPDLIPKLGNEIAVASLRAEASTRGFRITAPQAQSFLQRGLGVPFFNQAASLLPNLTRITRRFRRPGEVTLEDLAAANLGSNQAQNEISTALAQERSQFSTQGGVLFGQEGQLIGLTTR